LISELEKHVFNYVPDIPEIDIELELSPDLLELTE